MNKATQKKIAKRLKFISKQEKKTGLIPKLIDKIIDKHQAEELAIEKLKRIDNLVKMGVENFPAIGKMLEGLFGKEQFKVFRIISAENENKEAFTKENTKLQIGDTIKLKAINEEFWVKFESNDCKTPGVFYGIVNGILTHTNVHGINPGDRVQFTYANIFDIQAGSRRADANFNFDKENTEQQCHCGCQ